MQGLSAEDVLAICLNKIKSTTSGITGHSVEGLTLTLEFGDGTTETITFEQPTAEDIAALIDTAEVAHDLASEFDFDVDADGHLILETT